MSTLIFLKHKESKEKFVVDLDVFNTLIDYNTLNKCHFLSGVFEYPATYYLNSSQGLLDKEYIQIIEDNNLDISNCEFLTLKQLRYLFSKEYLESINMYRI